MSDIFKVLTLCAAATLAGPLALVGPTAAQTTEEAPAEPEAETEAPRADGLSTGQELEEIGSTYVKSEHADWDLRCIRAPEGRQDPCQLYQLLEDQDDNSVAEINMFILPEEDQLAAGANIVTPLRTLLTQQVVISVDGGKAKVYPFTFCNQVGCVARVGYTEGDVASYKRGNEAKIFVVPFDAPDQRVELTVSLAGFTAGFDALIAATQPEAEAEE